MASGESSMPGIMRRDYFAALAVQGVLANPTWPAYICAEERKKGNKDWENVLAKDCVTIADALIKVLDEKPVECNHEAGTIDGEGFLVCDRCKSRFTMPQSWKAKQENVILNYLDSVKIVAMRSLELMRQAIKNSIDDVDEEKLLEEYRNLEQAIEQLPVAKLPNQ